MLERVTLINIIANDYHYSIKWGFVQLFVSLCVNSFLGILGEGVPGFANESKKMSFDLWLRNTGLCALILPKSDKRSLQVRVSSMKYTAVTLRGIVPLHAGNLSGHHT